MIRTRDARRVPGDAREGRDGRGGRGGRRVVVVHAEERAPVEKTPISGREATDLARARDDRVAIRRERGRGGVARVRHGRREGDEKTRDVPRVLLGRDPTEPRKAFSVSLFFFP